MHVAASEGDVLFEADGAAVVTDVEDGGEARGDWQEPAFCSAGVVCVFAEERKGDVDAELEDALGEGMAPDFEPEFGGEEGEVREGCVGGHCWVLWLFGLRSKKDVVEG